jgi:hypothetical protein
MNYLKISHPNKLIEKCLKKMEDILRKFTFCLLLVLSVMLAASIYAYTKISVPVYAKNMYIPLEKEELPKIELVDYEYEVRKKPEDIIASYIKILRDDLDEATINAITVAILKHDHVLPLDVVVTLFFTESEFNKNAVSPLGRTSGYGLGQVSAIGLKEFNMNNGKKYELDEMSNIDKNVEVSLFLYKRNMHYIKSSDFRELYVAYNIGPSLFNKYGKDYYMNNKTTKNNKYNALKRFDKVYRKLNT